MEFVSGLWTSGIFCKNVFTFIPFEMLKFNDNDKGDGVTRMLWAGKGIVFSQVGISTNFKPQLFYLTDSPTLCSITNFTVPLWENATTTYSPFLQITADLQHNIMGTWCPFFWIKEARAWSWPLTSTWWQD